MTACEGVMRTSTERHRNCIGTQRQLVRMFKLDGDLDRAGEARATTMANARLDEIAIEAWRFAPTSLVEPCNQFDRKAIPL